MSRRLEADLVAETGLSLAGHDALAQLALAGGRLRMSDLAGRVLLSRSGMTRLVDRLESEGLVARRTCPSDARGAEAVLTRTGIARLRASKAVHLRGVATYFLDRIAPEDLIAMERGLQSVIGGSCESGAVEGMDLIRSPADCRGAKHSRIHEPTPGF